MTDGKIYAVTRESIETGEQIGYVAGLAENAGTWKVAMTHDSAAAEVARLDALDDGCSYWIIQYDGEEK